MPTINYFYADVYPDQLESPDVSVVISDEEWNRRIEQEHHWESNGRMARREISVFDAMMAELHAEKELRAEKFRRTHDLCKKSKDKTPADRKRDKKVRMRKLYGLAAFEDTNHGKTVFYWDVKGGAKKFPEYEAEIFRNLKQGEAEKSAYAELLGDPEHHVGFNTAERFMYNADKRMREIRAEMCANRDNDETVETYDDSYLVIYADGNGYQHPYPDEYYNEQATWKAYEYMIRKYGMDYANKYAKGEC